MARATSIVVCGFVVSVVGCAASHEGRSSPAAADLALASYRTEAQLSKFAFAEVTRCIDATPTTRLCLWQLDGQNPGWAPLGDAVGTRDRVTLICALPSDGAPRSDGSCAAYPRRSNRGMFQSSGGAKRAAAAGRDGSEVRLEQRREEASAALAAIHDLAGAVALVGDLPSTCAGAKDGDRTCVWQLGAQTYGHGTVAVGADAPLSKKVRLVCPIDAEGRLRSGSACQAHIAE